MVILLSGHFLLKSSSLFLCASEDRLGQLPISSLFEDHYRSYRQESNYLHSFIKSDSNRVLMHVNGTVVDKDTQHKVLKYFSSLYFDYS